uniref:Uncharacterized protein n=1 Tax=Panagrolaimus sp. ES5 TaxID=591445 RepID=A0AC34GUP3_9BILA
MVFAENPQNFINEFRPQFEFTLVASSTTSRHIKITGNFLQKSSFYSTLTNHNADKDGYVYLTSQDANKLAHEVYTSASFDEEVSKGYQASEQEDTIIKELLKNFEQDKVQSIGLSKEKWDSVFWDNIFTRPDIQTSFLNEVAKVDGHKKRVKFDDKKAKQFAKRLAKEHSDGHDDSNSIGVMYAGLGVDLAKGHGESQSDTNVDEDSGKNIDSFSLDKFEEKLKQRKAKVKWDGKKFVQKSFELCRVNTKNLKSVTETAFNRVIVSKEKSTQRIEIKIDTNETAAWTDRYDNILTLPTTTTTTTTTQKPITTRRRTTQRHTTTKPPTTTTKKPLCPDPIDRDLYKNLIMRGTEPCSYIHNVLHPTPPPPPPPRPPPPPPPAPHSTNIGDVANKAFDTFGKLCFWCG